MYRFLTIVIFTLFSINAHSAGWTAGLETKSLRIHPSYLAVHLHERIPAPDASLEACSGAVIAIDRNSITYQDVLSALLAANVANKKVKFYVTDCKWGYMESSIIWFNE
jgi:hypothetical protein